LKDAGVNMVSVSLNAHDRETYNQICRPAFSDAFESILDFVRRAKENFDVEITAVALPEVDMGKVEEISREIGVRFRRREYISGFW
jgi:TatD DNase family protein